MVQASAVRSVLAGLQALAFFAVEVHLLHRSGDAGFIAALMKNSPRLRAFAVKFISPQRHGDVDSYSLRLSVLARNVSPQQP